MPTKSEKAGAIAGTARSRNASPSNAQAQQSPAHRPNSILEG